jgi:hypothetical protein
VWVTAGALGFAEEAQTMRVEVVDGALSVELAEVPLDLVLKSIGDQAGVRISVRGDLGDAQPQAFENLPLDEGVRRLVGDNRVNLIMRYEVSEMGVRRLAEVHARAAGGVPPTVLEMRRMRTELSRVRPPPPPPPPPPAFNEPG